MAAFVFTNQNHGGEGFLGLSSISACLIFLFLTNAQAPIFGEAYELRKQRDEIKNEVTRKSKEEDQQQLNDILNAREHVKGMLKDPSSAKFSGEFIGKMVLSVAMSTLKIVLVVTLGTLVTYFLSIFLQ
ncbi:hypothetical protein LNP25_19680 [Klebsiella variicola subsp. variicola]|nr:hypothetical protein [Klebsiella variicola subsp. variicola]